MPRHKRHRGGQPGNQNARKHGFYAAKLTPQEIAEVWNRLNNGSTELELAVLRTKMQNILANAPASPRLMKEAKRLIYQWSLAKYGYTGKTRAEFRAAVRAIADSIFNRSEFSPEPIEAES
jgi:hypothetical protein